MNNELILFQHKDGRSPNFYCLYKPPFGNKQVCFSCKTSDLKQAQIYARDNLHGILKKAYEREYNQPGTSKSKFKGGKQVKPLPLTLDEFRIRYLDQHRTKDGQKLRPKSLKAILDTFNQLGKHVGSSKYIHSITREELRSFIEEKTSSMRSAEKHFVNLRAAFDFAVQEKWIKVNFFNEMRKPVPRYTPDQLYARLFTTDQFEKLYAGFPTKTYSDRRLRNLSLLVYETGLRHGEVRHVKLDWINWKAEVPYLKVTSDEDFKPKTIYSNRKIGLSENAMNAIRAQIQANMESDNPKIRESKFLFPNEEGQPLSEATTGHRFHTIAKQILGANPPSLHGLRHCIVTRLAAIGMTDRQIQSITGHSDPKMIQYYSHLNEELIKPVTDALNQGIRFLI